MKNYLIYKYTSPSGKSYIGQTCNLIQRQYKHKNCTGCTAFHNSIKKYGFENFTLEILEENLTLDEANIFEELYIELYNTLSPKGYNLHTGGLNHKCSDETKEKLKKYTHNGENNPMFGKHHTEESKEKIRSSKLGQQLAENNPMFGKHHTNKTKALLKSIRSKKYIITFPDGHEEIIIGLSEFCNLHNLCKGHMTQLAKGKYKQHKGFKCIYFDDINSII